MAGAAKNPPCCPCPDCRYVRDLPVDYLPLLENSCDPGHVHFTHAGFIGSAAQAGPLTIKLLQQVQSARGAASHMLVLHGCGAVLLRQVLNCRTSRACTASCATTPREPPSATSPSSRRACCGGPAVLHTSHLLAPLSCKLPPCRGVACQITQLRC